MQPQYRNYPITNQRSPHANVTSGRRIPGPPPVVNTGPNASQMSAAQAQMQVQADRNKQHATIELARRRATSPVEKNIPPGVDEIAIGDGVQQYQSLQEVERRLDSVMMRKRLDIQDSVQRTPKQYKVMRIWISNTVENQPWQATDMDPDAFDFSSNVEATYRVKIHGQLLDDDDEPSVGDEDHPMEMNGNAQAPSYGSAPDNDGERAAKRTKLSPPTGVRNKLSHFFKSITINLDRPRDLQPDGFTQIEWRKPERQGQFDRSNEEDFDFLEFERKSDENINVTINLVRDETPDRYRLSKPLASLLDTEESDRQGVLMGIWEYVKANGLQEDDENRRIICDTALQKIFHSEAIFFPQLPELIKQHMMSIPPISLPYTIRVDRDFHTPGPPVATIYDIPVAVDDPLQTQMKALIASEAHYKGLVNITDIDKRIVLIIQAMTSSKAKHDFFTSLSADPTNFIKRWISSQKRDLDVLMGVGLWNADEWETAAWRKGGSEGPWGSDEAWEGVGSYLSRTKAGHEFRGHA